MGEKYIFHMYGVNRFYGQKQVLKDINLSFYPGAKIGIVGENGSGKTTVFRIMAGIDKEFQGDAMITPGFKAGMVAQEPELDPELTVRQTGLRRKVLIGGGRSPQAGHRYAVAQMGPGPLETHPKGMGHQPIVTRGEIA